MENELRNFSKVVILVVTSLTYCYFISSRIQKGTPRLLSIFPVISIFLLLPLLLSSVPLQLTVSFFISWLANFKLILFAFDKDSFSHSLSLLHFITIVSLPIKINHYPKKHIYLSFNFTLKALLWALMIRLYDYKDSMHLVVFRILYSFRMNLGAELTFGVAAAFARILLGLELELQFNNPHLSTSLQNWWGKRWNLMSSDTLKNTIYTPLRSLITPVLGRTLSLHSAIFCTFVVSGLMHELMYFHASRVPPTWEVLYFFLIHGIWVSIEIEVKKSSKGKWNLHPIVSGCLVQGFMVFTCSWLCYDELIKCGADIREIQEYKALVEYAKYALGDKIDPLASFYTNCV